MMYWLKAVLENASTAASDAGRESSPRPASPPRNTLPEALTQSPPEEPESHPDRSQQSPEVVSDAVGS